MATHVLYTTYPSVNGTGATFDAAFRQNVSDCIVLLSVTGHLTQVITNASGEVRISGDNPNIQNLTNPTDGTQNSWAVFRFNDSLQDTAPYFFRIGFGRTNGRFETFLTIGNNVNPTTGVIGSPFVSNMATGQNSSSPDSFNTVYPSFVCANPGSISIAYKPDSALGSNLNTNCFFIGLYRKRNSAGTQLATGLDIFTNTSTTNISFGQNMLACRQHIVGKSNITTGAWPCSLFPTDRFDQFGTPDNNINVSRMYVASTPAVLLPELLSVGERRMGVGQTIDVPTYGNTTKYICVSSLISYNPAPTSGLLMNWF